MIKLNKKGMTTVEVLVCFVLVVIIIVSMYSTVSAYSAKRIMESNREEIIRYKNILTKDIMSDLTINGLVSASSEQIQSDDKTLVPKRESDGTDYYKVIFTLRGGQERTLEIERRLASSNESHNYNNAKKFFLRGDMNCNNELDDGDCRDYNWTTDNPSGQCTSAKDFTCEGATCSFDKAKEKLCDGDGNTIKRDYEGIKIDPDLGKTFRGDTDISISQLPNQQGPYSIDIKILPTDEYGNVIDDDNNDYNDYFSIKYNGITYPLPELGVTKNDNGGEIQDLRLTDVDIKLDGKVFYLKIVLQHRDFGNRYSINIVCPYNF